MSDERQRQTYLQMMREAIRSELAGVHTRLDTLETNQERILAALRNANMLNGKRSGR